MIDMCGIEEMRERGLSYGQISNKLGISPNTVCHYCHEHGIVGPNDFARASKKYPPEVDAMILRLRDDGKQFTEISRITGIPKSTARNRMRALARHELLAEAA